MPEGCIVPAPHAGIAIRGSDCRHESSHAFGQGHWIRRLSIDVMSDTGMCSDGERSYRQHRVADRRQYRRVMGGMIAGGCGDQAGRLRRPLQPVKGCPTASGNELLLILGRGNQRHVGSTAGKRCQNILRQQHESDPAQHPQDVSREVVVDKALRPLPGRVEKCFEALYPPGFGGAAARVTSRVGIQRFPPGAPN